jgi:hypothetical protein
MKIIPMGAEFFKVDRRTDGRTDGQTDGQTVRHDEANSRFTQFYECSRKPSS